MPGLDEKRGTLGGLVLTDDGLQRIAIDREHPDFC
jgi:hypothetical protein